VHERGDVLAAAVDLRRRPSRLEVGERDRPPVQVGPGLVLRQPVHERERPVAQRPRQRVPQLRRAGIRLRDLEPRLELGLQESAKAAVVAGYGVTFISRAAVSADLAAGTLASARVEGLDPARDISLVRSAGRSPTRAAEAFLEFARERL